MSRKFPAHATQFIKGQGTEVQFKRIIYRDSKGHFSKFTKKKKLSVEVYIKIRAWNKKKRTSVDTIRKSRKYSTKLQYRTRKISILEIEKRAIKKKNKGATIKWIGGMLVIKYPDTNKKEKIGVSILSIAKGKDVQRERERIEKLIMSRNKNL